MGRLFVPIEINRPGKYDITLEFDKYEEYQSIIEVLEQLFEALKTTNESQGIISDRPGHNARGPPNQGHRGRQGNNEHEQYPPNRANKQQYFSQNRQQYSNIQRYYRNQANASVEQSDKSTNLNSEQTVLNAEFDLGQLSESFQVDVKLSKDNTVTRSNSPSCYDEQPCSCADIAEVVQCCGYSCSRIVSHNNKDQQFMDQTDQALTEYSEDSYSYCDSSTTSSFDIDLTPVIQGKAQYLDTNTIQKQKTNGNDKPLIKLQTQNFRLFSLDDHVGLQDIIPQLPKDLRVNMLTEKAGQPSTIQDDGGLISTTETTINASACTENVDSDSSVHQSKQSSQISDPMSEGSNPETPESSKQPPAQDIGEQKDAGPQTQAVGPYKIPPNLYQQVIPTIPEDGVPAEQAHAPLDDNASSKRSISSSHASFYTYRTKQTLLTHAMTRSSMSAASSALDIAVPIIQNNSPPMFELQGLSIISNKLTNVGSMLFLHRPRVNEIKPNTLDSHTYKLLKCNFVEKSAHVGLGGVLIVVGHNAVIGKQHSIIKMYLVQYDKKAYRENNASIGKAREQFQAMKEFKTIEDDKYCFGECMYDHERHKLIIAAKNYLSNNEQLRVYNMAIKQTVQTRDDVRSGLLSIDQYNIYDHDMHATGQEAGKERWITSVTTLGHYNTSTTVGALAIAYKEYVKVFQFQVKQMAADIPQDPQVSRCKWKPASEVVTVLYTPAARHLQGIYDPLLNEDQGVMSSQDKHFRHKLFFTGCKNGQVNMYDLTQDPEQGAHKTFNCQSSVTAIQIAGPGLLAVACENGLLRTYYLDRPSSSSLKESQQFAIKRPILDLALSPRCEVLMVLLEDEVNLMTVPPYPPNKQTVLSYQCDHALAATIVPLDTDGKPYRMKFKRGVWNTQNKSAGQLFVVGYTVLEQDNESSTDRNSYMLNNTAQQEWITLALGPVRG